MGLTRWLQEIRMRGLRRQLASVEAQLAQERQYLPTVYPVIMTRLAGMRAELLFDIGELEKSMAKTPPR